MNVLEFEIKGQVLTRVDSQEVMNKNKNVYKCRFTFDESDEWVNANKFVRFTDGWGNSTVAHLGKSSNILSCLVPDKVLQGSYFKISVYAGNLLTTNNVSVGLVQSGYVRHGRNNHCHMDSCCDEKDIWVEVFERLDTIIDSIIYDNNTLHLFSRDTLIESIYLPFVSEDEVRDLVADLTDEFILENIPVVSDETDGLMSKEDKVKLDSIESGANKTLVDNHLDGESDNAVSNRVVSEALDGKEDTYDIVERIDNLIIDLINNGD